MSNECCGHNCGCHSEPPLEEIATKDTQNPFAAEEAQNAKNGAFLLKLFIGAAVVVGFLCLLIKIYEK